MRFWAGLLIVALAGCHSGTPAAPPIQLTQSPQTPVAPVLPQQPQPIRPDLVMAPTSEMVRPASFESPGDSGIRFLRRGLHKPSSSRRLAVNSRRDR